MYARMYLYVAISKKFISRYHKTAKFIAQNFLLNGLSCCINMPVIIYCAMGTYHPANNSRDANVSPMI